MSRFDDFGRPFPPSSWGGVGMPEPGYYRVKFVRGPQGLWVPARVRWERGTDPLTGWPMDRWAPVLRILDWAWWRAELLDWQSSLHPVTRDEFEQACEHELPCDPLEPYHAGQSRPVF